MADLDAELLALAGGDSSGEESMPSPPPRKSSSPKRSNKPSSPIDMGRKSTAKTPRKPTRKRSSYSDDDEESVASERSESASMSRSESEAEFEPAEDKPIFPYEKLYYDAADKAAIEAKSEIEREKLLAQRSEQVERHEQDLTLRRLLATRAKEAAKNEKRNKRKAAAADLDDSHRKSSRQRTKLGGGRVGEASSAIEAYKRQRQEKSIRDEQRRNRASTRTARSPVDDYSDRDAEADSDHEFEDRRHKRQTPTPPRDEPIADLADIQRARVGRDNFAQVCYTPGFENAITDCYARVCLGPGRTPAINEYRLCSVKGFTTGKPYAMTGSNGKAFLVNKYIIAAHGKSQKAWSFLECSMSRFTEDEWRRYRIVMANEDCKLPTRKFINAKLEQIGKVLNHKFTDAEISDKIAQQTAILDSVNRTAEKKEIQRQIDDAIDAGEDDAVRDLQERLMNIVPMKLALNTSMNKPETTQLNNAAERLAELNRRNERMNAENVRRAQLAELQKRKIKKKPTAIKDDLFGTDSEMSRAGTPVNGGPGTPGTPGTSTPIANGAGTPSNGSTLKNVVVPKPKKGLPVIRKAQRDDEILASMDLGIDIDI